MCQLPDEFCDLEKFVPGWAAPSADERHRHRQESTMADVSEFYEAMKPRIKDAIHYVDGFDIKALPIPVQKLFYLTFGYSEAAIAVEIFKIPGVTDVPFPSGFSVTREMYSPAAAV